MSAIEEARAFLKPSPGVSSTLHIADHHARKMIAEYDALAEAVIEAARLMEIHQASYAHNLIVATASKLARPEDAE